MNSGEFTTVPGANLGQPRRILIATDGGEPARWATIAAAQLASRPPTKVLLLHVMAPPCPTAAELASVAVQIERAHRRSGRDLLDEVRRTLPEWIAPQVMLRQGSPATEILAAAREWHADLIVMGTRRRGRLAKFVLGSTVEAVIRRAECPVLTVAHPVDGAISRQSTPSPATGNRAN